MDSTLLSLQHVNIGYPGKAPFQDISFEIKNGQHWAFINEGSLLADALIDALADKAIVSKGIISFNFPGKYVSEKIQDHIHSSPQLLIGFLSLRHHFIPVSGMDGSYYQQRYNSQDSESSLTVKQYLSAVRPSSNHSLGNREQIMKVLRVKHLSDEHLIKLSNGETRRVLIAALLLRSPVMLLLDHPFTGLDTQSRAELKSIINKISNSGTTIVISTSTHELPDCITHIAVFNKEDKIENFSKKDFNPEENATLKEVNKSALKVLLKEDHYADYEKIVSMKNVTLKFDGKIILDKINWTIRQGERWSLSGPNGSGKTSLLSLINGDNPQAFANDIILFDRKRGSGESIWDIKNKIGFFSPEMFQYFPMETSCLHAVESGFYDTMGLFRQSNPSLASKSFLWMEIMGIGHLSQKLLRNVNAGEQRFCLLARALVKNPTLLIFDEPCQGLNDYDQLFFKKLLEYICEISNVTMIYVTHYENEIPFCVNRFLKLDKGEIVD
ncbi:MAG: ATP-binding cassette domain-containing protein [Ginsengibacter sp.]